jgi:ABC-type polysaccharide/polyol phosphate transport system ATPase subunit
VTPAIQLEDVSKRFRVPLDRSTTLKYRVTHWKSASRYRDFTALQDITFEVPRGQFLGIIGHNGSGKSTLLKILSRIYTADTGHIRIDGHVSPFLELGVGFNPELTARENIYLNGAVLGLTRSEIDKRIDEIIEFAEVGEFVEQKLKNYSSGMQVRLAFSVAIQADAEILLMDEVLAVGDARFQERCFDVFARYKREGRTIVLVTHDLGSVDAYCDRAILLDHGRMAAEGTPAEVIATYRRGVGGVAHGAPVPDTEIPADVNRWGSRELEIRRVRLLDPDGNPSRAVLSGEPLVVEVTYEVHDDSLSEFFCQLILHRGDGLLVAEPNSRVATRGRLIPSPPRGTVATIRYEIDDLPLLAAGYTLSVGLCNRHDGHAFDHIERVVSFHVTDERSRTGLIELGGRFEYEDLRFVSRSPEAVPETITPRSQTG